MYCHDFRQNIYQPQMMPYTGMQQMPMQQMPMQQMPMQQMPMQQMPMQQMPMQQMGQGMAPVTGAPTMGADVGVSPFLMAGVQPPETPVFDTQFTQGYLRTQIGSKVRVEFLIGTSALQDRRGTLLDVGISYIIIREEETDDQLLCDIYSIKFVTFYR